MEKREETNQEQSPETEPQHLLGVVTPEGDIRSSKGGKPTIEAVVLVCGCGSTNLERVKTNKKTVVYRCKACDRKGSTSWDSTRIRASLEEITYGIQKGLITPAQPQDALPTAQELDKLQGSEEQEGPDKKPTLLEQGRCTARWSMTLERMAIMRKAMEGVRLLHMPKDENFKTNGWAEYAIELIMADVWAGLPDIVKEIVEEQESVIDKENEISLREKGKPLTKRNEARIRREVRERMSEKLGLVHNKIEESDLPHRDESFKESEEKAKEVDAQDVAGEDDGRVLDDGALFKALSSIQNQMNELNKESGTVMLVKEAGGLSELIKHADDKAEGHVLLVSGDKRTKTKNGLRPVYSVWIAWDDEDVYIDWMSEYLDQIDDRVPDADLEVTEVLPVGWDQLEESDKWEMPSMATERIVFNG